MWKKTVLIVLCILLSASLAFAVYKSTGDEVWDPINQSLVDFGRMTVGVGTISWENIRRNRAIKYKVILTKKTEWVIEFTEEPYPRFGNMVCRCIKFRLRYSILFPYQISLQAEFYSTEQNPFISGDTFSLSGSYAISTGE